MRHSYRRHFFTGFLLATVGALVFASTPSQARRRRHRRRARASEQEPKANTAAIRKLMGPFKFGMTHRQVLNILIKEIRDEYIPKIRKARGDFELQDRLRREMKREIYKVKKSYVVFRGQKTPWDGSVVDDQFVHNNDESMLVRMEKDQQRFFFFWHDRLYKILIAFNADHPKYKGLTFEKFVAVLIKAYGQGNPVFEPDSVGINRLHHVEWQGPGNYLLWALNKTQVFGNLCLVLVDKSVLQKLREARKMLGAKPPSAEEEEVSPLVKSITRKPSPDEEEEGGQQDNQGGQ